MSCVASHFLGALVLVLFTHLNSILAPPVLHTRDDLTHMQYHTIVMKRSPIVSLFPKRIFTWAKHECGVVKCVLLTSPHSSYMSLTQKNTNVIAAHLMKMKTEIAMMQLIF